MRADRYVLHLSKGNTVARFGGRGRGDGLDAPGEHKVLSFDGDTLVVRVKGHQEAAGYDRHGVAHGGMTSYAYIRAATHTFRVVELIEDRFSVYVEAEKS